jgi:hypothetical protein
MREALVVRAFYFFQNFFQPGIEFVGNFNYRIMTGAVNEPGLPVYPRDHRKTANWLPVIRLPRPGFLTS